MKERLAILIAAAMLITSMPFYAFAGDSAVNDGSEQTETAVNEGDGTENSEPAVKEGNSSEEISGPVVTTGEDNGSEGQGAGTDDPQPEDQAAQILNGWNEDHTAYYDENGEPLTDTVKKIDDVLCYFNADGLYDTSDGWKTASEGKYYIKSGRIVTAPTKIKVSKKVKYYYNKKTKKWQKKKISGAKTKYKTVTGSYLYMFAKSGKLKKTKGLFKYSGKEYYGKGNGVLKTGWVAFKEKKKGKASFFNKKTGAMEKNKKVKYLKIPKSGRLGKAYYLGVKRLNKTGWSLRAAYRWSSRMRYQGRSYRAKNSETYAVKGFSKGYGNCYCMAATFYIMAKLLGYDVHQVEGRVDLPHSWTVIRQDGRDWVYDPNFTNETGRNGWKMYYGKKGTWRYNHYHKMN